MIRVTSGGTSRRRAIHVVVMSAATVIFITATSCSNGSSARRSVSRNAGAASLPVTNRYRSAIAAPASAVRRRGLAVALAEDELVRGPLERAVVLRAPQHRVLDPASHREVLVGDAAGGVVRQLDPQLAPGHREVGVMVGRLAHVADGVDGHERRRPAVGVVLAADPVAFEVPVVETVLLQLGLDLVGRVGLLLGACLHGNASFEVASDNYITTPPLMLSACPVMNAASGEAR